jgi:cysteinyl-tRNA synthetase
MEKAAIKEGKKAEDIAKYYFEIFQNDLDKLNIIPPTTWSWATSISKNKLI